MKVDFTFLEVKSDKGLLAALSNDTNQEEERLREIRSYKDDLVIKSNNCSSKGFDSQHHLVTYNHL